MFAQTKKARKIWVIICVILSILFVTFGWFSCSKGKRSGAVNMDSYTKDSNQNANTFYQTESADQRMSQEQDMLQSAEELSEDYLDVSLEKSKSRAPAASGEATDDSEYSNPGTTEFSDPLEEMENLENQDQAHQRLIIYTGFLSLEVTHIGQIQNRIKTYIESQAGFVVRMDNQQMIIKVPAPLFDAAMNTLTEYGILLDKRIESEDVTKLYQDLLIKLDNALVTRDRIQDLLAKANRIEEILEIERELQRLTQTIEQIKGELKYYKENILHATITITYTLSSSVLRNQHGGGAADYRTPFHWITTLGMDELLSF